MIIKTCLLCKKKFKTYPCRVGYFCSVKCSRSVSLKRMIIAGKSHRYKKGHIPYSKIHPESVKKGKSHYAWKDIKVGYRALHLWLRRVKGKPTKCRHCGIVSNQPRKIDWANIDHKYSRNPEDYIPLCKSCHKIYDIKMASATRGS